MGTSAPKKKGTDGGKISKQPPTSLCTNFLHKENNGESNQLRLSFRTVWGSTEILLYLSTT